MPWRRTGEIDESLPAKRQIKNDELQIEINTLYFVVAPKRDNTQIGWLSSVITVALKRDNTQLTLSSPYERFRRRKTYISITKKSKGKWGVIQTLKKPLTRWS